LLVPPADAGALAAAIGRLLYDEDLSARLSVAGRERVLSRFTWRAAAEATVERYRAAADRQLAARPEENGVQAC
jgi:glycosyltransferase involved in cell wall biosynthesis